MRLVPLSAVQSQLQDAFEGEGAAPAAASEEDLVSGDLQICNVMSQALVNSGEVNKCLEASKILQLARDKVLRASEGKEATLQLDLLHSAVTRQLAEAHLCVLASGTAFDKRRAILAEVDRLDLGAYRGKVEHWWKNLLAKKGVQVLQVSALSPLSLSFGLRRYKTRGMSKVARER